MANPSEHKDTIRDKEDDRNSKEKATMSMDAIRRKTEQGRFDSMLSIREDRDT
jgi:hypothetical protein